VTANDLDSLVMKPRRRTLRSEYTACKKKARELANETKIDLFSIF